MGTQGFGSPALPSYAFTLPLSPLHGSSDRHVRRGSRVCVYPDSLALEAEFIAGQGLVTRTPQFERAPTVGQGLRPGLPNNGR